MKKGKILRLKKGYNPNSSSIGSLIPIFLFASVITGSVAVFISNWFKKADKQIKQEMKDFHSAKQHEE
jgi:hypothetical protein